ncbi:MAG: T9SS type A sorting domain-containing protein [Bacteroidales bacterium]|nr:T9SS type A sorting domain-containing protein [Bacteroidales bacterium]
MRKIILIVIISFLSNFVWSQIVFNRIIEDTVAHITSSVIALDTGYIILSGSGNEYDVRCFAIRNIDVNGSVIWKKTFGDSQYQYWEGFSNSIGNFEDSYYSAGSIVDYENSHNGIFLYKYNSSFDSLKCDIFLLDSIWKKGFNIIKHSSEYYYITGQVYSSELDDAFMYLLKIDNAGLLIWEKQFGLSNESGRQIIEISDSNILIGGKTFSFPTTVTDEDWYLLKLDTAGNVIWQNGFGRPGFLNYDGAVAGLIETRDSNYVACGGYPALRSDTDTYWDGCLRKVSTDGVLMWERFYRSYSKLTNPDTDYFENTISSVVYKNDDLFVLGNWRSRIGRSRGYLQKITENGDICWNREYYAIDYTTNNQYLVSFQPTSDNGFILAGYGNDYDSYGYNPPQQAWLVKTDSLGIDGLCYTAPPELNIDIILPETINCNDTITVYAYIAGKSAPYTIETSVGQVIDSIYYPPLFVPMEIGLSQAEIQYGGEIIYTQQITEATLSNHQWGQCIAKPVEFYTPHTSGSQQINITVTDAYGESKTITKEVLVNECGQSIADAEICSVNLYPNPTKEKIYLDIPTDLIPEKAEVYNSLGQLVKSVNVHSGLNVVDVSDFATGNYIIKINVVDKTYSLNFEKH